MSRKHTTALKSKSQEITAFATKTFITLAQYAPPNQTVKVEPPYLIWHPAEGENSQERVSGPRVTQHPRFTGHIVGVDADQVQLLMDLLKAKLFPGGRGVVLTVAGEKSNPLWYSSPEPIRVSTDPLPAIVYGIVEVGWTADPTP